MNINVPLMDAMKVPTYARYIKDIIDNKRPLPTTEVIKLTEACICSYTSTIAREEEGSRIPNYQMFNRGTEL